MKLFKEMFFKLLLFIIFGLIYYVFLLDNFLSSGIFGFVCFGIMYVLVEIIYRVLNEKTKFFTKKISMIILIVIGSIIYLGTMFAMIDYDRATNGEEPIFTWKKTPNYEIYTMYTDGKMNEKKGLSYTEYNGLGYSIIVCSKNVICNDPVKILPFGLGAFGFTYVGE